MGIGSKKTDIFLVALFLIYTSIVSGQSSSSSCSYTFSQNKEYATCVSLSPLNCYLHWTYNATTGIADIAFRATISSTGEWAAWALNPTGDGMVGAQALVAYRNSSGLTSAYTSSVESTLISTLTESALSFTVTELAAESSESQIIIFAKVQLPNNQTSINHVWQVGPLNNDSPAGHVRNSDHLSSTGTVNFLSTVSGTTSRGSNSKQTRKNIHGVLNAVSWGTLMPIGFLIARYLKVFKSADPAWFYLHILCQSSAYVIGVAGWGLGLKIGSESEGVTYPLHRNIGIILFCLATLQVFALLLRPNKDHKHRMYWNYYHHSIGYIVIALSILNVFKGLDILDPEKKWKTIYIVILVVLASIAVFLEVITWIIVLRRKKKQGTPYDQYPHGRS